jgi:hypothetical protein
MAKEPKEKTTLASKIASAISSAARTTKRVLKEVAQLDFFAKFKSPDAETEIVFPVDLGRSTVWATQVQIAALFDVDRSVISKHIKNILDDKDLDDEEATSAKFARVQIEGGKEVSREVEHYGLGMILAVGYRVNGKRAGEFRKWASRVLRGYIGGRIRAQRGTPEKRSGGSCQLSTASKDY